MKRRHRHIALAAAFLPVAAAAFWFAAPYNIAASVEHYAPIRALLNGYMKNAVAIRAARTEPPDWFDPDDPALIRLGAGHFATGCAACHGAPGRPRSPVVRGMLPEPTRLESAEYSTSEYYWLVRHGLKYTGMPGWAGEGRDDEPWALAAFLGNYAALSPGDYHDLAWGPSPPPSDAAAMTLGGVAGPQTPFDGCARCHGRDGLGRDGTAPKLAGQSAAYLAAALDAYAGNRRQSGFMEPVAAALSPRLRAELARRFAGMPPASPVPDGAPPPGDAARGRTLAERGDEHDEIPSCIACHGGDGTAPRAPDIPRLAGQDARWIVVWLRMWRDGPIPDTPGAPRMAAAARGLDDDEIADLAAFYSTAASAGANRER